MWSSFYHYLAIYNKFLQKTLFMKPLVGIAQTRSILGQKYMRNDLRMSIFFLFGHNFLPDAYFLKPFALVIYIFITLWNDIYIFGLKLTLFGLFPQDVSWKVSLVKSYYIWPNNDMNCSTWWIFDLGVTMITPNGYQATTMGLSGICYRGIQQQNY